MLICRGCGIKLPEEATYCPNCGVELNESNVGEAPEVLQSLDRHAYVTEYSPSQKKWKLSAAHFLFMIPLLIIVGFIGMLIMALTADPIIDVRPQVALFHEGLTPVMVDDGGDAAPRWGYINRDGEQVITAQFDQVTDFGDNGLAAVCYLGKWGFINKNGDFVIQPVYEEAQNFGENDYAPVKANGSWGYIDEDGVLVINPQFDSAYTFADNGLALVEIGDKYGYINRKGVYVISPQYDAAESFGADGYAAIYTYGKWGLIDKSGEYIINPQFDTLYPFAANGLALVEKDGTYGYVDRMGVYMIQPIFEDAYSFGDNGLALVKQNGKYGFINGNCEFVIDAIFDKALPFDTDSGLAAVCPDAESGLWGYIDYYGKYVIDPTYIAVGSFCNGIAAARDESGLVYIEKDGDELFRPEEDCLFITHFTKDGYAILAFLNDSGESVFRIIDKKGKPITETDFPMVSFSVLAQLLLTE